MQLMEHEAPGGKADKACPVLGSVISWKPDSLNESTLFFKQKTKAFHG